MKVTKPWTTARRRHVVATRLGLLLLVFQVAGLGAVAAGELVPDRLIVDELNAAVDSGTITATTTARQRTGGISDHFGECVLLSIGLGAGEDDRWFSTIATSPNLGPCPAMIDRLERHEQGERLDGVKKIRYWNGLSVVTRPALATVGVNGLRALAMLSLAGSVVLLAKSVASAVGGRAAAALIGPVVAASDLLGLVEVFHHPLMLSVAFVGAAALASSAGRDLGWRGLLIVAFAAGSVYSFVDLMNFVPGVWVLSTCIAAVCVPSTRALASRTGRMLAVGVAWPAGYLTMWIGKWVWAAVATSPSAVYDEITTQIEQRINGDSQYATGDFGAGLRANVRYWLDQPLVSGALVICAVVAAVALVRAWRRDPARLWTAAVVVSPALILVPWFLITNNHNEIHYWFEYRSLPMALGAGLMALHAPIVQGEA